jgi:hypothetical protein
LRPKNDVDITQISLLLSLNVIALPIAMIVFLMKQQDTDPFANRFSYKSQARQKAIIKVLRSSR